MRVGAGAMWDAVLEKLARLKGTDLQCQAFGATAHRYCLNPPVTPKRLAAVEHSLGAPLPAEPRDFYLNVGDGGAGPHYGLRPAAQLDGFRPAEAYPGIRRIRAAAAEAAVDADVNVPDGYFEAPEEVLAGLVAVIDEGCGHRLCLVTNGPHAGRVVHVSADGFVVERKQNLREIYEEWRDQELERFAAVRTLIEPGATFERIQSELVRKHGCYDAGDRIASIANVEKPESLFGRGGQGRYHRASQFPWYARVLREWQAAHR